MWLIENSFFSLILLPSPKRSKRPGWKHAEIDFKKTGGVLYRTSTTPFFFGSMYSPTIEIPKFLLVCSAGDPTPTGRNPQPASEGCCFWRFSANIQRSRHFGDGQPDPVRFQTPFSFFSHESNRIWGLLSYLSKKKMSTVVSWSEMAEDIV